MTVVYVLKEDDGYDYMGICGVVSSVEAANAWVVLKESGEVSPSYLNYGWEAHEMDDRRHVPAEDSPEDGA